MSNLLETIRQQGEDISWLKANLKTVLTKSKDFVTPEMFGAKCVAGFDNSIAIQKALNFAAENKKPIEFCGGTYEVSKRLFVNLKQTKAMHQGGSGFSIHSNGVSNTSILYTGIEAIDVLTINGSTDDCLTIDGIRVCRPAQLQNLRNGTGIKITRQVNFSVENVVCSFFGTGIALVNVNEGVFKNVVCEHNQNGLLATLGGEDGFAIAPNAIHFDSCAFNSNIQIGAEIVHGCVNMFTGCRFLGNGINGNGRALKITYVGINGGVSANITGNYFESTKGIDIEVISTAGGAHYISGNSFNKLNNERYADAHIKFTPLNLVLNDGKVNRVTMKANSMWSTPSYTASSTRPCVVMDYGANGYNGWIVEDTNHYQNPAEAPVYSGSSRPVFELYDPANYIPVGLSAVGGVLDLRNVKAPFIFLGNASGTVITSILGIEVGREKILQSNTAITIQHNAGTILKGFVNFTFAQGGTITLFRQHPDELREVARQ